MKHKKLLLGLLTLSCLTACRGRSPQEKYGGHGFEYMNGYSSTDFTGYHVYDDSKLYHLDHPASLQIEKEEDMPILDGAEACYPVYSAVAKAVYKDIDKIERKVYDERDEEDVYNAYYNNNGKIVTFTNTVFGYDRLIQGNIDMMFAARPSTAQKAFAASLKEQIVTTPIGKEAFVFFVEEDNPVDSLTSDQLRAIYHGDITNWKEVGGKDQEIVPFQRPEESGSQVMMKYFMGDVSLKKPKTYEYNDAMTGVIEEVAQYNNEAGALGYTFKYFLTGLHQEQHVKILSVDGIAPTAETISHDTYPITGYLMCATLASNQKPYVKKMLDFLLSPDGQEIIEQTGYAPLSNTKVQPTIENEISKDKPTVSYKIKDKNQQGTLDFYYISTNELEGDVFILNYGGHSYKGYFYEEESEDSALALFDNSSTIYIRRDGQNWVVSKVENPLHYNLPEKNTVFHKS
ncbi:MAG: PstS family phosphate ABC transporter substrate-binding protein [bacterium]